MIAVIDERTPTRAKRKLEELGFVLFSLPSFSRLATPVASHPDMLMFPFEGRLFVHKAYFAEAENTILAICEASGISLCLVDTEVAPIYPHDISLNIFQLGKHLIGNRIPNEIASLGYSIIHARQGYAKCSSLVLDHAVITADPSIADAVKKTGAEVLLISPEYVSLPGYDYGFLGGASGVCGNTVYFCGDIEMHPDEAKIKEFCHAHGYEVVSLTDEPLLDVGTLFFL